ncbi:LRR receptor-like serine/threonine-protein kinase IOS1 isoform X2 [Euphorbia lathyris]|uniref:LRR receptor-like serine/threonine-protein kinase IOS1 isoform X2 n=1 Tax=Euphorbia lathyris TaxID=212925 RepID=UPI003313402B
MAIFLSNLQTFHFPLLTIFALIAVLQAQDQSGFISIDCGLPDNAKNYTDTKTTLVYVPDSGFIDTGISKSISTEYSTYLIDQQLQTLRTFPQGDRNCYEIQLKMGSKYLIRAVFMYGNHDSQNKAPTFDLHLGSKKWDTVDTINATMIITKEIIHMTSANYIHVCLVNTGSGTPFISTLELRPVKNNSYNTDFGSLSLFTRLDIGSSTNQTVRYADDVFDRKWVPYHFFKWAEINTAETIDLQSQNNFRAPSVVMRSAGTAANPDEPMQLFIDMEDTSLRFLIYMHFAEIVKLQANQTRIFNISLNGQYWSGPVLLEYLYTTTIYSPTLLTGGKYEFSIFKIRNSTLPPLINGIEIFSVVDLLQTYSNQKDVEAIKNIKNSYEITRNWQGDPCAPRVYLWDGLNCSYPVNDVPRIISLNLSSIGLTGEIPRSISSLTSLQSLDLSNNNFTGSVPDFLSQLPSLKVLNLARNQLSGSVPASLLQKSKQKTMELSVGENPNLCASSSCESKKKSLAAPIVASIAGVIILIAALATFSYYILKRRKQQGTEEEDPKSNNEYESLESKGRHFTYSEVVSMTNNFKRVLGKGGFGTVYHGYLDDTEVAVKMLSPSSAQGYKQFQAEVSLLLRVHHRNLTSLVGFFEEGTNMGLIYEYMANGDIEHLMSGSNRNEFGWAKRLQVVVEAAQGLEYLHNGCKPPIVHRDVKPANILLNDKFQAKLADFGLSRSFPLEGETHISTVVAGTPGYLDPEYSVTNWLTEKSDVYSFGIVILNMITGRPGIAMVDGRNTHICKWVKSLLENGDIKSVVDPSLGKDFEMNSVWKAVEIAMTCTSPTSAGRPTMHQVVTELNECLEEEMARRKLQRKESDSIGSMEMMTDTSPLAR